MEVVLGEQIQVETRVVLALNRPEVLWGEKRVHCLDEASPLQ
jgi:hypothetical protein